jgi:hypothetical protein
MKMHLLFAVVLAVGLAVGCTTKTPKSARDNTGWDGPYLGAKPNPNYTGDTWEETPDDLMMEESPGEGDEPVEAMTEPAADDTVSATEPTPETIEEATIEPDPVEDLVMPDIETASGEQAEPEEVAEMEEAVEAAEDEAEAAIEELQDAAQAMDEAVDEVEAAAVMIPEDMVPVDSSAMDAVKYDDLMEVLTIQFGNGRTYDYLDVPPEVYEDFLEAASKGSFFRRNIEDTYQSIER